MFSTSAKRSPELAAAGSAFSNPQKLINLWVDYIHFHVHIFGSINGICWAIPRFPDILHDLGVNNAIYLVGSVTYGYFRDRYDHLDIIYDKRWSGQRYENHIQWVAPGL